MYRPKRNVNVFSLSALDLFASAMGAFVIICIILFPSYLKTRQALTESADLESQITEVTNQLEKYEEEIQRSRVTVTLEDVRKKRQESEQQLKIVRDEVKKLSEKLKRSVKFVLLGLQTDATKFTIVVDLSGSMKAYETLLVEVCDRIIGAMQEGHSLSFVGFRIVGSSPDIQVWPTNRKPIAMDDKGKEAAILHVKGLFKRFDGGTPTYDALLAALDMPGETVVLVTDGIPSYPVGLTATQIVDLITTANHGRKQIHAVGIGKFNENPVFIAFLEKLSRENGGDFASFSR